MVESQEKKKRNKVLFRADGNNSVGLGHVYRCLAIAERLSGDFECFFAIMNPPEELVHDIRTLSTILVLDPSVTHQKEAEAVAQIVREKSIDIITLDGYHFDTAYQGILKQNCNATLVSIDDDQQFHYLADVVINHAPGIGQEKISREAATELFLGADYFMIRKNFLENQIPRQIGTVSKLLICFGGADPFDHTGETVRCITRDKSINTVTVILGAAYEHFDQLKQTIAAFPHIVLKTNLNAGQMAEEMLTAEMAIVPASTISLEAFAMGMAIITGTTASNQENIYQGLLMEDRVHGIGDFNKLSCVQLSSEIATAKEKFRNYNFTPEIMAGDKLVAIYNSI